MYKSNYVLVVLFLLASGQLFAQNGRQAGSTPSIVETTKISIPENYVVTPQWDGDLPFNSKDNVVPENQIVQGSLAVGVDAIDGEIFGYNTIILKENNLRIKFDDTSTEGGSFPGNDWIIEANSSDNGGASYYAIQDATALTYPYKIMAGAPTDALHLAANGNIGFRTDNPIMHLHMHKGDTPGIRFEQSNESGWTPYTWDVAGNESNFFIRDLTAGSHYVFTIKPGAPNHAFWIASDGNVGVGFNSPDHKLHVNGFAKVDSALILRPKGMPATPEEGQIYMDETAHSLRFYNGTEWNAVAEHQNLNLAGTELSIDNGNTVELAAFMDNTDEQDLVAATLDGNMLEIDIENGSSVSVDLSPILADLEARVTALENASGIQNVGTQASLSQNTPNPFENSTSISYFIPETTGSAILRITDVHGAVVRDIPINLFGKGSVIIDNGMFKAGSYFYTLIIDDKKTDSKIMIKVD